MSLLDQYQDILNLAHARAWELSASHSKNGRPDEPGIVSQILSPPVAKALQLALENEPPTGAMYATLSGAFIHQTPKVTTKHGTSELGDLLLVAVNERKGTGRATFFQAKCSSTPKTGRIRTKDRPQFELYRSWPAFTLSAPLFPPGLQKSSWQVQCNPWNGLYMAVFDGHAYAADPSRQLPTGGSGQRPWKPNAGPGHSSFGAFAPWMSGQMVEPTLRIGMLGPKDTVTSGVGCAEQLATCMHDMLREICGAEFKLANHVANRGHTFTHWDDLINGFLDMGANQKYRYTHAGTGVGGKRGQRSRVLVDPRLSGRHQLALHSFLDSIQFDDRFPYFGFAHGQLSEIVRQLRLTFRDGPRHGQDALLAAKALSRALEDSRIDPVIAVGPQKALFVEDGAGGNTPGDTVPTSDGGGRGMTILVQHVFYE